MLVKTINQTLRNKDSFLSVSKNNIENVISHENHTALANIDKRLEELQIELVKLANSKAEYDAEDTKPSVGLHKHPLNYYFLLYKVIEAVYFFIGDLIAKGLKVLSATLYFLIFYRS